MIHPDPAIPCAPQHAVMRRRPGISRRQHTTSGHAGTGGDPSRRFVAGRSGDRLVHPNDNSIDPSENSSRMPRHIAEFDNEYNAEQCRS